jgi:hypothetical protein
MDFVKRVTYVQAPPVRVAKIRDLTAVIVRMVLSAYVRIHAFTTCLFVRMPLVTSVELAGLAPVKCRGEVSVRQEDFHLRFAWNAEFLDSGHQPVAYEGIKRFG